MKKLVPLESVRSPLRPRRRDVRVAVEGFATAICDDIRAGVEPLRYQCDCVGSNQPISQSERSGLAEEVQMVTDADQGVEAW